MDLKQAVGLAKQHILELFAEEELSNVGLEEVELDEGANEWIVTVGFSRPWDQPRSALAALTQQTFPRRSYKVVRISNASNQVLSVKNREAQS